MYPRHEVKLRVFLGKAEYSAGSGSMLLLLVSPVLVRWRNFFVVEAFVKMVKLSCRGCRESKHCEGSLLRLRKGERNATFAALTLRGNATLKP